MRPDKKGERWGRRFTMSLLVLWLFAGHTTSARGDFNPEAVFGGQCSACHTVGRGDDVGPDLAGVTERRDREWLIAFIRSSQTVIRSGDLTAGELFERYGRQKMPDHDYTADQVEQILDYIEAGGPGKPGPDLRLAETATPLEIKMGRQLFHGTEPGQSGVACASCHTLSASRPARWFLGGSLAGVYSRYRDVELAKSLEGMRMLPALASSGHEPLTAEQSFCLRAFLRSVDEGDGANGSKAEEAYPFLGFGGGLVLIAACGAIGRRRT